MNQESFKQSIERLKRKEEGRKKPQPPPTNRDRVLAQYERKVNPELTPVPMVAKSVRDVLKDLLK